MGRALLTNVWAQECEQHFTFSPCYFSNKTEFFFTVSSNKNVGELSLVLDAAMK